MPIAAIIGAAVEAIKLGADILEASQSGATQEELNAKWANMQERLRAANARWEAAGPQA